MGQIDSADARFSAPEKLNLSHDLSRFQCGEPALDEWLAGRRNCGNLGNSATCDFRAGKAFYEKCGFTASPIAPMTLTVTVKEVAKMFAKPTDPAKEILNPVLNKIGVTYPVDTRRYQM